jgi:hypothetical protein
MIPTLLRVDLSHNFLNGPLSSIAGKLTQLQEVLNHPDYTLLVSYPLSFCSILLVCKFVHSSCYSA